MRPGSWPGTWSTTGARSPGWRRPARWEPRSPTSGPTTTTAPTSTRRPGELSGTRWWWSRRRKTGLYAVLEDGRFPLAAMGDDRFLNGAGEGVVFERGEGGEVVGYRVLGEAPETLYRRLGGTVDRP